MYQFKCNELWKREKMYVLWTINQSTHTSTISL
jgi:hypothetical protein